MSSKFIAEYSEIADKAIKKFKEYLPSERKFYLISFIEIIENNWKKQKSKQVYLEEIINIKQRLMKMGVVEVTSRTFGEAELVAIFDISKQADIANIKKLRRIVFSLFSLLYLFTALSVFLFTFPISLITANPVILSAGYDGREKLDRWIR